MDNGRYTNYQTSKFTPRIAFSTPAGWQIKETVEDDFKEIHIFDPAPRPGEFRRQMTVGYAITDETINKAASKFISDYRSAYSCKVVSKESSSVAGKQAVEIEINYATLLSFEQVKSPEIAVRERHVFFRRGGLLFELAYSALEKNILPGWKLFV